MLLISREAMSPQAGIRPVFLKYVQHQARGRGVGHQAHQDHRHDLGRQMDEGAGA